MKTVTFFVTAFLAIIFSFIIFKNIPVLATFADNIYGYAWSSNIGWISFNDINAGSGGGSYGVRADSGGNISGYAWSPNIGWISFNPTDVAGCPGTLGNPVCAPKINLTTREVSGWARSCAGSVTGDCAGGSRSDGWDGWISLRGESPAYGVVTTSLQPFKWSGWAWGGEVVGWISFNGDTTGAGGGTYNVTGPDNSLVLVVAATATPNPARVGRPVTWSAVISGGTPPYTYTWSGDEGLTGSDASLSKTYTTTGVKTGTVIVTESGPAKQSQVASFSITVIPAGSIEGIKEIIPE